MEYGFSVISLVFSSSVVMAMSSWHDERSAIAVINSEQISLFIGILVRG